MMDKQYRQLRASTSNIDETQPIREPHILMFLPLFVIPVWDASCHGYFRYLNKFVTIIIILPIEWYVKINCVFPFYVSKLNN